MNFLQHFDLKNLKYNFLNKFTYKKSNELPKLKKIILNIGCKNLDLKELATSLLVLELITSQKGKITTTKYSNILLKIRKGNPTGCKVILRKTNMFNFLAKILIEVFHKQKKFAGFNITKNLKKKTFSYKLKNVLTFNELENHYYLFNNLSPLDITFVTNVSKKQELIFILKSLKFPLK
jgi:large subunit ribosomal protein L5